MTGIVEVIVASVALYQLVAVVEIVAKIPQQPQQLLGAVVAEEILIVQAVVVHQDKAVMAETVSVVMEAVAVEHQVMVFLLLVLMPLPQQVMAETV
jgi:hypothetical protein